MFQDKCSSKRQKETYSYQSAQAKIAILRNQGYHLVGSLPDQGTPWSTLKSACFLFIKDSQYYQYQGKSLLSDLQPHIRFDETQTPATKGFSKIMTNDYIYVICPHKTLNNDPKPIFLLRKGALISGHEFLIAPYKIHAQEDKIVGGELYYLNGAILLINRKSGSFPTSEEKALTSISAILGPKAQAAYHSAIEEGEVLEELRKRTLANAPAAASSLDPAPCYQNKSRDLPQSHESPQSVHHSLPISALNPATLALKHSFNLTSPSDRLIPARISLENNNTSSQRFFNKKSMASANPPPSCTSCIIL